MKNALHDLGLNEQTSIRAFAKQFAIPVKLSRQLWEQNGMTYMGAYNALLAVAKSEQSKSVA